MPEKYGHLIAPNGKRIIGSVERILGRANVNGFTVEENGEPTPDFEGYTEVFYDTSEVVDEGYGPLYEDESGNQWPLHECTFVPTDSTVRRYTMEVVVEVEAESAERAWEIMNARAQSLRGSFPYADVTRVTEPEEVEE